MRVSLVALKVLLLAATPLSTDRTLDTLPHDPPHAFAAAARRLGAVHIAVADVVLGSALLTRLARPPAAEPYARWVREQLGRPVDIRDLILFLDDLASASDLPSHISVPSSRARAHGILLHPQDIFRSRARRYGTYGAIELEEPPAQPSLRPPEDGAPAGPRWTARYPQPTQDAAKLRELRTHNPRFGAAVTSLYRQLRAQGAEVHVESGVRARERGFLIFGSWYLARATNLSQVRDRIAKLDAYETAWGLDVPIRWRHPDGLRATQAAAQAMADTYGVDYATLQGARNSSHYGGRAVDLVAVDLPRRLRLHAPDGQSRRFDLSHPREPRDLSLTPELIRWIEVHFSIKKLRKDYPHWSD